MKQKTFNEIEEMYRSYPNLKTKLALLQPKNTRVLSFAPSFGNSQSSQTEILGVERADVSNQIKLIQFCLAVMTHDERLFIEYRYFRDLIMDGVASNMNWSKRELFRLRHSVLAKTRWLLGLPDTKFKQKTS